MFVTNAAGGLEEEYKVGDLMLLKVSFVSCVINESGCHNMLGSPQLPRICLHQSSRWATWSVIFLTDVSSPHLNLEDDRYGARFVSMSQPYELKLRNLAKSVLKGFYMKQTPFPF